MIIAYEDKEQPPYYMGNGPVIPVSNRGVAVDLILGLEDEISDLHIKLVRYPWPRCLLELKNNEVDGIFNASYERERLQIGWYPTVDGRHEGVLDSSRRITRISYSLYKKKTSSIDWNGLEFVNYVPGSLGAPLGYSIVGDLKRSGISVYEFHSTDIGFEMLLHDRFRGIIVQNVTGDSLLSSHPDKFAGIVRVSPPIINKDYFLMLSDRFVKSNGALAARIWDAIREHRRKGD